jgi:exonuclease SbcC
MTAAIAEHTQSETAHERARATAQAAQAAVADALAGLEAAQTADRAASLRVHLVAGEPCPVCEQDVARVPAMPRTPALTAARKRHADAEKAALAAADAAEQADRALRQLDRALAAATAQHDESARRLITVDNQLADAPPPETVRAELDVLKSAGQALAAATEQVRHARQVFSKSRDAEKLIKGRLEREWREFHAVRDSLAAFKPPAPDRDDLVGSWQRLGEWALAVGTERARVRDALVDVAASALAALEACAGRLGGLFARAGLAAPRGSEPAGYRHAAALAGERAAAALARVLEKRDQLDRLAEQVAGREREAQVAKALALHLRSDRFERWLLAEALDALVGGASRILRELSSGQYDLTHDKGEFFVIDHTDASMRRGVRTLSGGETFQASLALALALSEQLAGLSTASASLESIMLDEGFGTLDASTLDTVAATLENLAARGDRMVGVVTHVVALAERIPVRFEVTKDARGVARVERSP